MRINTNVSSMTAQESAANVNKNLSSSLEKLSSGLRINKASDDASGMAIADKLRTQASSLGQSIANGNSANALVQIADKAMAEQSNILDIVKTKLIQAATSTTSDEGKEAIKNDIQKLLTQLDNIADQTNYNGQQLLDGTSFSFQIGEAGVNVISAQVPGASDTASLGTEATNVTMTLANTVGANASTAQVDTITIGGTDDATTVGDTATVQIQGATDDKMYSYSYTVTQADIDTAADDAALQLLIGTALQGLIAADASEHGITATNATNTITLTASAVNTRYENTATAGSNLQGLKNLATDLTEDIANQYMDVIDGALNKLNLIRSEFGATQNQIESSLRNMMTTQTNIKAAESVIRDVDYAAESANFNRQNIIAQAGTYAMSQANAVQQNVLRLLQ